MKSKIESRIFLTQKQLRKLLPNRSHSPIEIYLPTHYFMPGNGTILPQLRATLCHYQAKSGISLLSHLNRAHSLMPHALQTERKNWFLKKESPGSYSVASLAIQRGRFIYVISCSYSA